MTGIERTQKVNTWQHLTVIKDIMYDNVDFN